MKTTADRRPPTAGPDWMLAADLVHFWRRGWGQYPMQCPICYHEWVAVAAVGTVCASVCPACSWAEEVTWGADYSEMPNDGVWL